MINLTGRRFGRLVVIARAEPLKKSARWLCRCDCGRQKEIHHKHLVSGATKSCRCLGGVSFHDVSTTPTARSWYSMMHRCYDGKTAKFYNYGGRGVRVCGFLRGGPQFLIQLLGARPDGMTLDRIAIDGHYSCGACPECLSNGWPRNVRWSTLSDQNRNRRRPGVTRRILL